MYQILVMNENGNMCTVLSLQHVGRDLPQELDVEGIKYCNIVNETECENMISIPVVQSKIQWLISVNTVMNTALVLTN